MGVQGAGVGGGEDQGGIDCINLEITGRSSINET